MAPNRERRGLGWPAAFLGLATLVALLAAFVFYRTVTLPERIAAAGSAQVERLFESAKHAFGEVMHARPRIVVNERVVLEQESPVLELAVLQREITVERETENTWLDSTKRLRIRGTYRVKAGYDLKQPIEADINGLQPQLVRVQLPRAKVLSVELEKLDMLTLDNGLWNRVQPEEFATEVNSLNLEAQLRARTEGLPAEAEKMLTDQLRQRLGPDIHLEIDSNPVPLIPPRR